MIIKRGHLYVADLSPRLGAEPGKQRPVVVIQNDDLNLTGHSTVWVLPCTTKLTPPNILRVRLPRRCAGLDEESDVMIDLSRAIDARRIKRELGKILTPLFSEIVEKLRLVGDL